MHKVYHNTQGVSQYTRCTARQHLNIQFFKTVSHTEMPMTIQSYPFLIYVYTNIWLCYLCTDISLRRRYWGKTNPFAWAEPV